jgi:predicted TPR repeat methyltransferase
LRDLPLPYPAGFFDHVLSIAVLNSFRNLDPLFQDIARIIKEQGVFAFTVEDLKPGQDEAYAINRVTVTEQPEPETAVHLFRHSEEYIARLLDQNGFVPLKAVEFLAFKYPAENRDVFFKAYVARKSAGSTPSRHSGIAQQHGSVSH